MADQDTYLGSAYQKQVVILLMTIETLEIDFFLYGLAKGFSLC